MEYIVLHLACAVVSILIQSNDSNYMDIRFVILYIITGPIGLLAKLLSKII